MNILLLTILLTTSYLSIRYTDLILSIVAIGASFLSAKYDSVLLFHTKTFIYCILFLFLALFSTSLAWIDKDSIDLYQFIRALSPLFMLLFQMSLLSNSSLAAKIYNSTYFSSVVSTIEYFIYLLAVAYLGGILVSLPLMPGIYIPNSLRVFPPLSSIVIPISILAFLSNKFKLLIACSILLLAFQSRSNIIAFFLSTLLLALASQGKAISLRQLSVNKKSIILIFVICSFLFLSYAILGYRFELLLEEGDTTRRIAGELAVTAIKDTIHLFFGIGIGIPHSHGYYWDSAINAGTTNLLPTLGDGFQRLLVNSTYDIESLYTYIQVRHGLLGAVVILSAFLHSFKTRLGFLLFAVYLIINGFGSSLINTFASPIVVTLYMYIDWLTLGSRKQSIIPYV